MTANAASASPKVFISYSWDDVAHTKWTKELAARLRRDGIDVTLDQWRLVPGDQLPKFMETAIRENSHVLILCTPNYKIKSDERRGGVGYEGDIMSAEVFTEGNHRKFIPILRSGTREYSLPSWLRGKYFLDLSGDPYSEASYRDLLATLHNQREQAPALGQVPSVAARADRQQELTRIVELARHARVKAQHIATMAIARAEKAESQETRYSVLRFDGWEYRGETSGFFGQKPDGLGVARKGKTVFRGDFRGAPNGLGVYDYPEGQCFSGEVIDGDPNGFGIFSVGREEKITWYGRLRSGCPLEEGVVVGPDGSRLEGQVVIVRRGDYEVYIPQGYAIALSESGIVMQAGVWSDGEIQEELEF